MAGQTTYYQLETYESNDVPDLRDQYNSSMIKIDAALNTIGNTANSAATGVSGAVQNAQAALDAAASALTASQSAQASAEAATTAAQTATSTANTAQSDATSALASAVQANNGVNGLNTRVTALENNVTDHFVYREVAVSGINVSSNSIQEITSDTITVDGYNHVGIVQTWATGSGTTLIGAPWFTVDNKIKCKVFSFGSASITIHFYAMFEKISD